MILFLMLWNILGTDAQGCLFSENHENDTGVLMLQNSARHAHSQLIKKRAADFEPVIAEVGPVFESGQTHFLQEVERHQLTAFDWLDWFTPECSAAYDAHDSVAFAMKLAARRALMPDGTYPEHGFSNGDFHTAPGTWATGARLCYDNGFLDLPTEALWDFEKMKALSETKCNELARTVSSFESLGVPLQMSLDDPEMNQRYSFRKCSISSKLGTYGLGCAMANCMYSYCFLADGRVGQGKQCNSSWMEASLVSPHMEAVFGFSP